MKVLLAYRAAEELAEDDRATATPAGLRFIAARLRAEGHQPVVANLSRLSWKQVTAFLDETAPACVGISCLTFNRRASIRLARLVKRRAPGAAVILGGPHAAALPEALLRRVREVDAIALGEGEEAMLVACRRLADGLPAGGPGLLARGETLAPSAAPAVTPWDGNTVADLELAGAEPLRDLRHVVGSRPRSGVGARRAAALVADEVVSLRATFGLTDIVVTGAGLLDAAWLADLGARLSNPCASEWEVAARPQDVAAAFDAPALESALWSAREGGLRRVRFVMTDEDAVSAGSDLLAEASRRVRACGIEPTVTLRIGALGAHLGSDWLHDVRGALRALRPAHGDVESRELLPHGDGWAQVAAEESLDDSFWFDDDRSVIRLIPEGPLERATAALDSVLREIAREASPGPRDLDALEGRGESGWTHVDWGDYRARQGDAEEAERRYRLAAVLLPDSTVPWLRLAALCRKRPVQVEREVAALRQVVARVPRHAAARRRMEELRRGAPSAPRGASRQRARRRSAP